MDKKAERALSDARDFPIESLRERLARRYGLDAVALSGPCEGQPLVDCIADQLEKRWNDIKSRFAGDTSNKVLKLAMKMAESYMQKDDTEQCVSDLTKIGYEKKAAEGIAGYLKAYAIDLAADNEVGQNMDAIQAEPAGDLPPEGDMGMPPEGELPPPEGDMGGELPPPEGEIPPEVEEPMEGGVAPADMGQGAETVSIELPIEVAQQVADAIQTQVSGGEGGLPEAGMPGEEGLPEGGGLEIEIMPEPGMEESLPGDGVEEIAEVTEEPMAAPDEVVPGEPAEDKGEVVESNAGCAACSAGGPACAKGAGEEKSIPQPPQSMGGCPTCGHKEDVCPTCGHKEAPAAPKPEHHEEPKAEHHESPVEEKHEEHEKHESKSEEHKEEKPEDGDKEKDAKKSAIAAAANMRAGHLRKVADNVLKIGPEMAINTLDQCAGHDEMRVEEKEKGVEEPKALEDGNVHTEGYSAGDNKFQDGKTMGHEQKFDAKPFDKASATGGEKSIMGKDESFPEGKAKIPAGSAPIGHEKEMGWEGGDVSTKGTVIATIRSEGILVEANGKKYIAKGKITHAMVAKLQEGLAKLTEADGKKFAQAAAKLLREAEKSGNVDNVCKIPTSKLEAEKFTNDGKKKPEEGGAMTEKGKAAPQHEDETKIDTSKLEKEKFTNDGKKEPEKDAATQAATVKTAKPIEDPKPLPDGNVHTEGYSAGDNKFQDGKTMGHEQKFDAKEVNKSDVMKGDASLMGKEKETFDGMPKGKADVPAGGGAMGHEKEMGWEGGDVSTKGTTIAENQSQNREATGELQAYKNEAKVREERLKSASVYVADLLRHGEITEAEYAKELEKTATMSVPAIQNLIASTRKSRERVAARAAITVTAEKATEAKVGLTVPVVISASNNEKSLKDRLVENFKLTRDLDRIDEMPQRK